MTIATHPTIVSNTALLFPGQGSQKAGMLSELAEAFTLIGRTFDEASHAIHVDLWAIAQGDDRLHQTEYTQPVLLTASIALWRLWLELGGTRPAVVAGHSLGEYSALVAAGVMSLTDGVRLVRERGRLMQMAVPAGEGAMAAILGLDDARVIAQCAQVSAQTALCVDAANFNADGQVVIAGQVEAVRQAIVAIKAIGGKAIMLPVSVPSHCRLMQPAADQLSALLADLTLHQADMPVIQNAHASIETDPAAMRQALIDQLSQPVRWTQTMHTIATMGMTQVVECGAGNVLSNLAKRMSTPLDAYAIDTRSRFEQALSAVSLAEGNLA
jgi:[acyl-carrier-protein] S-malonyltransferase